MDGFRHTQNARYTQTAAPARPDVMPAGELRDAGPSLRHERAETIAVGLAFALLPIAWAVSGLPATSNPWSDFALSGTTASFGCLMLVLLRRQKRAVTELRRNQKQIGGQKALLQSTLENMGEGLSSTLAIHAG